ncbi:winged helix-turn-helix transcriptional regulator [Allostreptomyces psammosilenae]|uniref:DNA-binding HxlR family transcriptional regulator n=1 Tax=Allostreptomyces psammosilenae TaxID=1892865 RepID=A0A852ZRF7_9ACTN|nr:helix-turn-helix domain-containing protein [Allostreptomyces psammosilenae]NYI04355.1 DNA-binding HxlR family transcriptional regulator [Allostreptomyces psammosilenae]
MDTSTAAPAPQSQDADLEFDVFARACPSRPAMEHVTSRWGLLALGALHEGALRFNALRRRVDGVSEKMLSQTLHALERDGFVHREVQATIPPRVEYSLTPLGRETAAKLIELIELLESRMPHILQAQRRYDEARGEG